ncbi:hypothetical protein PRVXH_001391 [Proteinivorax hydrogeniformans]|uniref:YceG-like family protein n=1 Tax=Proteinivorax hydrogeniformans TaxID=1826727 RepID=A0AAU8HPL7_9FIRM
MNKLLIGVGIGLLLSYTVLTLSSMPLFVSEETIVLQAKSLGMIWEEQNEKIRQEIYDEVLKKVEDDFRRQEEDIYYKIDIPKGSSLKQIAQILKERNIINDEEKFITEAQGLEKSRKLHRGTFFMTETMEIKDIIEILSN